MGRRKRKRQKRQLELSNQEFTDVPISFAADSTGKISGRLGKSIMNAKLLDKQNDASNEEFEEEDDEETHESIVTPDLHSVSFISNTANFQPVSNLRFSIVVACECCLISKKSL